jgi:hypothetical protein
MKLYPNTIMGFLKYWGPIATDEEIGMAVGILLGALARRGTPSRLMIGEHELNFTNEALDSRQASILNLLKPQEKAGAPYAGDAREPRGEGVGGTNATT